MRLLILLALMAPMSCGTDTTVDPVGSWNFTLTWGSGSCGMTGSSSLTTRVSPLGEGYTITESGTYLTGKILCTPDSCRMSFTESGPFGSGADRMTLSVDLAVDTSNAITGSGLAQVTRAAGDCSQVFSALGALGP